MATVSRPGSPGSGDWVLVNLEEGGPAATSTPVSKGRSPAIFAHDFDPIDWDKEKPQKEVGVAPDTAESAAGADLTVASRVNPFTKAADQSGSGGADVAAGPAIREDLFSSSAISAFNAGHCLVGLALEEALSGGNGPESVFYHSFQPRTPDKGGSLIFSIDGDAPDLEALNRELADKYVATIHKTKGEGEPKTLVAVTVKHEVVLGLIAPILNAGAPDKEV